MIHKRFGSLVVVSFAGVDKWRHKTWNCLCDCGNSHVVATRYLNNGRTSHCGCKHPRYKTGNENVNWKGYKEISHYRWGKWKLEAEKRNLEFKIEISDAWEIFIKQNRQCALSGLPIAFTQTVSERYSQTASLDRINSDKGYVEGNIQWLHKDVNMAKQNFSQEYFLKLVELIYKGSVA